MAEAIDAGREIDKILIRRDLSGALAKELFDMLKGYNIPVQKVPIERINRITRKNHQGVLAFLSQITYHNLEALLPDLYEQGKTPFLVALDGITDVRNFGAIARTAECAGVHALIVPEKGGAPANADAVKTSAGALNKIPVCRVSNIITALRFLKDSGCKLAGASEKGSTDFAQTSMKDPICIVMGAEDTGLSPDVLRMCDDLLAIPILGTVQSLNVSVAAGILMYEVVKQRG